MAKSRLTYTVITFDEMKNLVSHSGGCNYFVDEKDHSFYYEKDGEGGYEVIAKFKAEEMFGQSYLRNDLGGDVFPPDCGSVHHPCSP